MEGMINLGIFFALLLLGLVTGRIAERRHYKRIIEREAASTVMVFSDRNVPSGVAANRAQLVQGSAVISHDYFKAVLASLRKIFGGRLGAYESLLDRARREAVLRMKDAAQELGSNMVINVKFETTSISKGKNLVTVEVLVYGTALA